MPMPSAATQTAATQTAAKSTTASQTQTPVQEVVFEKCPNVVTYGYIRNEPIGLEFEPNYLELIFISQDNQGVFAIMIN
jgi:anti-sigma regulatory factor (Ser/Thr protein kinase)